MAGFVFRPQPSRLRSFVVACPNYTLVSRITTTSTATRLSLSPSPTVFIFTLGYCQRFPTIITRMASWIALTCLSHVALKRILSALPLTKFVISNKLDAHASMMYYRTALINTVIQCIFQKMPSCLTSSAALSITSAQSCRLPTQNALRRFLSAITHIISWLVASTWAIRACSTS